MGSGSFWSLTLIRTSNLCRTYPKYSTSNSQSNFQSTRILTLLKEIFWILLGKFMSGSIIVTITKSWLFYVTSRSTYAFSWVFLKETWLTFDLTEAKSFLFMITMCHSYACMTKWV